jgi:hypothetical protein
MERFPRGIGAEVGVYHHVPGRARPNSLSFRPPSFAAFLLNPIANLTDKDLWWAYRELNTQITFSLTNPVTKETFFSSGPKRSYWLNRWMNDDSSRKYKRDQGPGRTPTFAVQHQLNYTINGKSYPAW